MINTFHLSRVGSIRSDAILNGVGSVVFEKVAL